MVEYLRQHKKLAFLLLLAACIQVLKYFPSVIEQYYSLGLFPYISFVQRALLGWIPFSVGDLLLGVFYGFIIYKFFRLLLHLYRRNLSRALIGKNLRQMGMLLLGLYVSFYLLWGLNYYRQGSSYQLQLIPDGYTTADLDTLVTAVNTKLNKICMDSVAVERAKGQESGAYVKEAIHSYALAAQGLPFLQYKQPSIKPAMAGNGISYLGTLGYANPFTGEAQINYGLPKYLQAYTICHEMAHQLGYASESEANLIGYLSCKASTDLGFQYSVYSSLQLYALRDLFVSDSVLAKKRQKESPPILLKDRRESKAYFKRYENPFDPLVDWIYDKYLKSNNQPLGYKSYNYVVAWLIAYGKKYGWQNI